MSTDTATSSKQTTRSPRELIIYGQAVWMVVTVTLLTFIQMLSFELFYTISFMGLLILGQLFSPRGSVPKWWRRFRIIVAVGFVVMAYLLTVQSLSFL